MTDVIEIPVWESIPRSLSSPWRSFTFVKFAAVVSGPISTSKVPFSSSTRLRLRCKCPFSSSSSESELRLKESKLGGMLVREVSGLKNSKMLKMEVYVCNCGLSCRCCFCCCCGSKLGLVGQSLPSVAFQLVLCLKIRLLESVFLIRTAR